MQPQCVELVGAEPMGTDTPGHLRLPEAGMLQMEPGGVLEVLGRRQHLGFPVEMANEGDARGLPFSNESAGDND